MSRTRFPWLSHDTALVAVDRPSSSANAFGIISPKRDWAICRNDLRLNPAGLVWAEAADVFIALPMPRCDTSSNLNRTALAMLALLGNTSNASMTPSLSLSPSEMVAFSGKRSFSSSIPSSSSSVSALLPVPSPSVSIVSAGSSGKASIGSRVPSLSSSVSVLLPVPSLSVSDDSDRSSGNTSSTSGTPSPSSSRSTRSATPSSSVSRKSTV